MSQYSSDQALALVQAFIQASVHDRDDAAVKALVTRASAEQGNFNPPPDAGEMRIDIGVPELDGTEWVVPVTINNPKDTSQPEIRTPFTLVEEDGDLKIDMLKTMDRMFGGGLSAMMDGMVDALKGVGEAMAEGMKQAFEGIGEAMGQAFDDRLDASQDPAFNALPQNASPQFMEVFNRFHDYELPDQLNLMREAMGSDQLNLYVDWSTFNGDVDAAARLTNKVLHNLRSAICLSCSDDRTRDLLRDHLHEIVVHHIDYPEGSLIRLAQGRLHLTTCLVDTGAGVGYHSSADIIAAIRDALDLDKGPAVEHLIGEVIPQVREELRERLELDVAIDVDLASFTEAYDTQTAVRHLELLESQVFRNFVYFIREVNEKVPLADVLTGFRIEHVGSASSRTLLARGGTILIRINLDEPAGLFSVTDLETLLPGVAASLPDYSDPASRTDSQSIEQMDVSPDAFEVIGRYRDDFLPGLSSALQQAVERPLDIEVDWASIGDDAGAADLLPTWGLNRVVGALRLLARDLQTQQDMGESIQTIRFANVGTIDQKQVTLDDGVLSIHVCLNAGEDGCFYERDIAERIVSSLGSEWKPRIEEIRRHAHDWEEQLADAEYDAPVRYEIDFAGFTTADSDDKVRFALSLLREHGVDVLFYAITRLFGKNPNFKQQFKARVRRLIVQSAADPSAKGLTHLGDAIVYQAYLHEGYKGYLTIEDMVKRLPGIVSEMSDIFEDTTGQDSMDATPAEMDELDRMARIEDEMDQEQDDAETAEDSAADAEAFAQVRRDIEAMMGTFTQQFAAMIGKPLPLTIEWDTLDGEPEAAGMLLNACLSPLMNAFIQISQNPSYRDDAARFIHEVTLARSADPEDQSMRLQDGVLSMTVYLDAGNPMPLPADEAPAVLKGLIDFVRASGTPATKPKPKAKQPVKSKPVAKAAKKVAKKAPVKKAAKPAATPKKVTKAKPAPKKKKGK